MRRLVSHSLLLLIILLTGWLIWQILSAEPSTEPLPVHQDTGRTPLAISGMTYNNYQYDRLVSHISVDELLVQSRSFGFFRIRSINEAVLTNARIQVHNYSSDIDSDTEPLNSESPEQLSLSSAFSESIDGLSSIRGMGRITRALFRPISLTVFTDQSPSLRLRAQSAELDMQKKNVEFHRAQLGGSHVAFRLTTQRLIWNERLEQFQIPGDYQLHFNDRVLTGRLAQLDGNLNLRVLPGGTPPKSD